MTRLARVVWRASSLNGSYDCHNLSPHYWFSSKLKGPFKLPELHASLAWLNKGGGGSGCSVSSVTLHSSPVGAAITSPGH